MGIAANERTEPRQKLSLWTGKRKHDKGAVYHRRVDAAMQVKALTTAEREEINKPMKRYGNLINEIIDRSNLEASFDEVTCDPIEMVEGILQKQERRDNQPSCYNHRRRQL
jgi:hypothetical protein